MRIISDMGWASQQQLSQYARVLTALAARHGLSELRRAGDGRLVADLTEGRTYLDVARFELDAGGVLGSDVQVILAGTAGAARVDRGALVQGEAA